MKNEKLRLYIHDLSNKLTLVDGKLKKARKLSCEDGVNVELDKAIKNNDLAIDLLLSLKSLINEDQ